MVDGEEGAMRGPEGVGASMVNGGSSTGSSMSFTGTTTGSASTTVAFVGAGRVDGSGGGMTSIPPLIPLSVTDMGLISSSSSLLSLSLLFLLFLVATAVAAVSSADEGLWWWAGKAAMDGVVGVVSFEDWRDGGRLEGSGRDLMDIIIGFFLAGATTVVEGADGVVEVDVVDSLTFLPGRADEDDRVDEDGAFDAVGRGGAALVGRVDARDDDFATLLPLLLLTSGFGFGWVDGATTTAVGC